MENNLYAHGFARVAVATFVVKSGEPLANAARVVELARAAAAEHAAVVAFPAGCLTGGLGDLAGNVGLQAKLGQAVQEVTEQTADLGLLVMLDELLEVSCYTAQNLPQLRVAPIYGGDLAGQLGKIHNLAAQGVNVFVQMTTPQWTVGDVRNGHRQLREISKLLGVSFVQARGARGMSSTDSAYEAGAFICADGEVLAVEEHLADGGLTLADVNLSYLGKEAATEGISLVQPKIFTLDAAQGMELPLLAAPAQRPLVPASRRAYRRDLGEAFEIQVAALAQRLRTVGDSRIVLGLSGGLDSTLALLVACAAKTQRAMERNAGGLEAGKEEILTFTMPGFATGEASRSAAIRLAAAIGVSCETIDIRPAATAMLQTMGHPAGAGEAVYDITYENVQAGLRADYLFRLANQRDGFVLGTGDLSELALGWCTYGVGDHMSHYAVNSGVPKSMMRELIRVAVLELEGRGICADEVALRSVVSEICAADITPELIPAHEPSQAGSGVGDPANKASTSVVKQTTEGTIGPYVLHDFFLYHLLHGAAPAQMLFMAQAAFAGEVETPETIGQEGTQAGTPCEGEENRGHSPREVDDWEFLALETGNTWRFQPEEIQRWLQVFLKRFVTQQFKRSAMPDGPVLWEGMSLSPRAGFRFPSDLSSEVLSLL